MRRGKERKHFFDSGSIFLLLSVQLVFLSDTISLTQIQPTQRKEIQPTQSLQTTCHFPKAAILQKKLRFVSTASAPKIKITLQAWNNIGAVVFFFFFGCVYMCNDYTLKEKEQKKSEAAKHLMAISGRWPAFAELLQLAAAPRESLNSSWKWCGQQQLLDLKLHAKNHPAWPDFSHMSCKSALHFRAGTTTTTLN